MLTIYCDPSSWGTLQLTDGGLFKQILDTQAPTTPTNLKDTLTNGKVTLSWDASTDNRVVQNYIVYFGTIKDTLLSQKSGNSLTIDTTLANGTYNFGVVAVDLYGNASAEATKSIVVNSTSVKSSTSSTLTFYPNPVTDVIRFNGLSDKAVVNVYSVTGQLIISNIITKGMLDVSSINSGIYLIKISNGNSSFVGKFIKK